MKKLVSLLIVFVLAFSVNLLANNAETVATTHYDMQHTWVTQTLGNQIVVDEEGNVHLAFRQIVFGETDTTIQMTYANATTGDLYEIPHIDKSEDIVNSAKSVTLDGGRNGQPLYFWYGPSYDLPFGWGRWEYHSMAKFNEAEDKVDTLSYITQKTYYHQPWYALMQDIDVDEVNGIVHLLYTGGVGGKELAVTQFDGTNFGEVYNMGNVYPESQVPGCKVYDKFFPNGTLGADLVVSPDGAEVAVIALYRSTNITTFLGTLGGNVWPDSIHSGELTGVNEENTMMVYDTTGLAEGPMNLPNNGTKPCSYVNGTYDDAGNLHIIWDTDYFDTDLDTADGVSYWGNHGDSSGVFYGTDERRPRILHWTETYGDYTGQTDLVAKCQSPPEGEKYEWFHFGVADSGWAPFADYAFANLMENCRIVFNEDQQEGEPLFVAVWAEIQDETIEQLPYGTIDSLGNEIHESDYYAYKRDLYISTSDDGATWSNPINITNTPDLDENEVSAFDDVIDNKLHITYTEDQLPGNDMMLVSTFKYDDQYAGPYQTNDVYIKHMAVDLGGVGIDDGKLARNFKLEQNYPNPFNPTTKISYSIPSISNVKLMVYNILGQKVKTLVDNQLIAGNHTAMWDGTNDAGSQVSSGIYIYKLKTKAGVRVKKMVLQK